ncbi:MAG TPA: thioredoxin family protein [Syntrophales bacterium]|nr:thioredoxin family protein [Syntrophales bacterium]HOL58306.1 thioredoxin family protein [Syntrophales bacterium]HPO34475.1 thioredoxin family protein [Syntrophales bacterium]
MSEVRQIRIKGNLVGIIGLDRVLEEVSTQVRTASEEEIGAEMIKRLEKENYIPSRLRDEYQAAFVREYKKFTGQEVAEERTGGLEVLILGPGCAQCDQLEEDCRNVMAELGLPGAIEHVAEVKEIARYGVMGVPALLINGKVLSVGRVPPKSKIREWLVEAAQREKCFT